MKKNKTKFIISTLFIFGAVVLTVFRHWEPGGENWGYWTFAQIFRDTGKFIILDRSPLYILYLNVFLWLGYPVSVILEFLVTSFIMAISIVILIRPYTGWAMAVFVTLLWLPVFQHIMPPPVQQLALASSCCAVVIRRMQATRFRMSLSYALLGIAFLFRPTYIILIMVFLIWDMLRIVKQNGYIELVRLARPRLGDWPIGLIIIGLIWFTSMQSQHRWNGPSFSSHSTTTSLAAASFFQEYTEEYYQEKIREGNININERPNFRQEVFGDAETIVEAFISNPEFVIKVMFGNVFKLLSPSVGFLSKFGVFGRILSMIAVIAIFIGAFLSTKDNIIKLFFLSTILLLMVTILSEPKWRYMVPFFPVLVLGIWWYSKHASVFISRYLSNYIKIKKNLVTTLRTTIMILLLLLFSNNSWKQKNSWVQLISDFASDVNQHEVRILENHSMNTDNTSMKASFEQLDYLIRDCNGILTLEYLFIGAFMIPRERVYSIWLSDYTKKQLRPDSIDCVLLSNVLMREVSNHQSLTFNYDNYIKPYVQRLRELGADTYKISGYGEAIIFRPGMQEK